jgi:hypothetical protein
MFLFWFLIYIYIDILFIFKLLIVLHLTILNNLFWQHKHKLKFKFINVFYVILMLLSLGSLLHNFLCFSNFELTLNLFDENNILIQYIEFKLFFTC